MPYSGIFEAQTVPHYITRSKFDNFSEEDPTDTCGISIFLSKIFHTNYLGKMLDLPPVMYSSTSTRQLHVSALHAAHALALIKLLCQWPAWLTSPVYILSLNDTPYAINIFI